MARPKHPGRAAVRWLCATQRERYPEAVAAVAYAALRGEPVRGPVLQVLALAGREARRTFLAIAAGRQPAPEVPRAR